MRKYTKEFGSYYLRDDRGNILLMADEVAVGLTADEENVVLHKHGALGDVEQWAKVTRQKNLDLGGIFGDVVVLSSRDWNLDDLNRIVNNVNYVKIWMQGL